MGLKNKLNQNKKKIFSDRLFIMGTVIAGMFLVLVFKFYKLQIIDHDANEEVLRIGVQRTVETPAVRGMIYDRYGKPLAINKPVYMLKVDPQVTMSKKDLNRVLLNVANLLEENGDTYIDRIPISKTEPFTFTESKTSVKLFINSIPYNGEEHKEEILMYTAEELLDYLRSDDVFQVDEAISDEDARKIVALRLEMYQYAYQKYKKITIAEDITMETLAAIEENQQKYPSIMAEVEAQRYYTYGKEFGNILGYTRTITAKQYEQMKEQGYDQDDIIGQGGIESSMEDELKGEKGQEIIEVDNVGRKVFTLYQTENKVGNDVYLSMDANLQLAAYQAVEKRLSEAIVQRMKGGMRNVQGLTGREILISMIDNNQLSLKVMESAPEEEMQSQLYKKINASYEEALIKLAEDEAQLPEEERTTLTLKQHFSDLLHEEDEITNREMLLALSEQGSLQLDESLVERIWSGNYPSVESILIAEFEAGRLKPDQMDIAPFSASAVVVDVNTGDVLALVGYPSYDSNEMTHNFNTYYTMLHDGIDNRNLLWNRATRTAKAPGSTYKMITGIAGLEEGVIDAQTVVNDTGVYTKAGSPYPRCWIYTNNGYGHGNVDLERALEVSCNFYFYEVAYRLGQKYGMPYGGIEALTKYAKMFGLNDKTNIELEEEAPNISDPTSIVRVNATRALNTLKNMDGEGKASLKANITSYLEEGFYPYGSSRATDVEGRITYITQYEIKRMLDTELALVLSEDLPTIFEKYMTDLQEALSTGVTSKANTVVENVLADTSDQSLKAKTKEQLKTILLDTITSSTRKTIAKTVKKIPQKVVLDSYRTAYSNAYARNEGIEGQEEVLKELEARIAAIDAGTFDATDLLVERIEDRLLSVYLDDYFSDVQMEWTTAKTIRTAIGQENNMFTPAQIARYIAGLANGKEVYDLKVVSGIYDNKEEDTYVEKPSKLYNTLNFKESTLQTIYQGMYRVINGSEGSGRNYFVDFPIEVAGKSGTAQEGSKENSFFVGFAPYDDPQIAVVVNMYDSMGLGTYNGLLARDIFSAFFGVDETTEKVTLDNTLIP